MAKHCAKVVPGEGRLLSCLLGARDKVTAGCKAAINAKRDAIKKLLADCKADLNAHCAKVPAGKGRKIACLKGAQEKLQPQCKAHFEKNTAVTEEEME